MSAVNPNIIKGIENNEIHNWSEQGLGKATHEVAIIRNLNPDLVSHILDTGSTFYRISKSHNKEDKTGLGDRRGYVEDIVEERKAGGDYYLHIRRIFLRSMYFGCRNLFQLMHSITHDMIETKVALGRKHGDNKPTPNEAFSIVKRGLERLFDPASLKEHGLEEQLPFSDRELVDMLILTTRKFMEEDGVYTEDKKDPDYLNVMENRFVGPTSLPVGLYDERIIQISKYSVLLGLAKGEDTFDNITDRYYLSSPKVTDEKRELKYDQAGKLILIIKEYPNPQKEKIDGIHGSYVLGNYAQDYKDSVIKRLEFGRKQLGKSLISKK